MRKIDFRVASLPSSEGKEDRGHSIVLCRPPYPPQPRPSIEGTKDTTKAVETRPIRLADSFFQGQRPKNRLCSNVFLPSEIPPSQSRFSPALLPSPTPPRSLLLLRRGKPRRRRPRRRSPSRADTTYPPRRATKTTKTGRGGKLGRGLSRRHISRKKKKRGIQERERKEEEEEEEEEGEGDRNRPSFVHTHSVCCGRPRTPPPSRFKATSPWER